MRENGHRGLSGGGKYYCLLPALLLGACTARLDINTTDAPGRLVVYGVLTTDFNYHGVQLATSSGFFSDKRPGAVSGARVTVRGNYKTYDYFETGESGFYTPEEGFSAEPGHTYTLTVGVDLDGDGTDEVFSAVCVVPEPVSIDRIAVRESESISNRYEVLMWGELPAEKGNYISFSVARDSNAFTDSLSKYRIIEDRYFASGPVEGLPCFFLSKESGDMLEPGDVIGLKVDVMEAGYGKFLGDAQSELTGSIPLFSGPPGNVGTNIRQLSGSVTVSPLGYFGASAVSRSFTEFYPGGEEYPQPLWP